MSHLYEIDVDPKPRYRLKSPGREWFDSLTDGGREVVVWFSTTFGRGNAWARNRLITDFLTKEICIPELPPRIEQYEWVHHHFERFQEYASGRMVLVEDWDPRAKEGGAA